MRKISVLGLLLLGFIRFSSAQGINQDKESIQKMCGCYQVDFEYAETFSDATDYEFHDRYAAHGLEWIFTDEEAKDKVVLQHLLIVHDTMIVKHWRQDWLYENRDLLVYNRNLEWKKKQLNADQANGTWTQKVYQVDDSPRYEGYATWVHLDGKDYWESQVFAPLPRREYTKRSDYNVMLRTNKHKITSDGHVHELDNAKIIRSEQKDSVLVWEKGLNTYTRVDDSECEAASAWWKTNRAYWVDVRQVWDEVIAANDYLNLKWKVEDKKLWQQLFTLGSEYSGKDDYNSAKVRKAIRKTIDVYLTDKPTPWTTASGTKTSEKY